MRRFFVLFPLVLALAACNSADAPMPTEEAPLAQASSNPENEEAARPDYGALHQTDDPVRLVAFVTAALQQGRWEDAARAWRDGEMNAADLQAQFGGAASVRIDVAEGQEDAGAGSLYYEAPFTAQPADGAVRKGRLLLRRVNDVPGASEAQLDWHVERLEWAE